MYVCSNTYMYAYIHTDTWMCEQQTGNTLTAVLIVSFHSCSQFYLAYIEISYVYDFIYDLIQGEGSVSNCTAIY